jgi:serine-type D-Ala-D-Ala carboxypeptidase/endopeptidase
MTAILNKIAAIWAVMREYGKMAMKTACWVCGLCCLGMVATRGAEALAAELKSDNPVHSALDRVLDTESVGYFHSKCHVGLSLAIVNSNGTHYYDYGATMRSGTTLADRRSIYEIASVTKVFTATLAAKAVVDRRMTLDGDFRQYLPDTYSNLAWDGQPITLRWLVTHRSGMPRDIPDTDVILAKGDFHALPYEMVALAKDYSRSSILAALHGVQLQGSSCGHWQ